MHCTKVTSLEMVHFALCDLLEHPTKPSRQSDAVVQNNEWIMINDLKKVTFHRCQLIISHVSPWPNSVYKKKKMKNKNSRQ